MTRTVALTVLLACWLLSEPHGAIGQRGGTVGADRLTLAAPPRANPTFHCMGLAVPYAGDDDGDATCVPEYREMGADAWTVGHPMFADRAAREFRGSLVGLQPGTPYEVRLDCDDPDGVFAGRTSLLARTWAEELPIAETITIPGGVHRGPLQISRSGSEDDGHVLYAPRPGQQVVIDVGGEHDTCVTVAEGTSYVIVRGLDLRNAGMHGVDILEGCHHVVVERCTITGWGREGGLAMPDGDMDAAIHARRHGDRRTISHLLLQDNTIRLPRGSANDWSTGHPLGPQGITLVETGGSHVIRYNEITSDDAHWYNDGIGGGWNNSQQGSPHRDSDIYGNVISHCHDDAIEAEGGDVNVRIWGNRISNTYVGIALAPVLRGPAYVWRNVITDFVSTAFKAGSSDDQGRGALYVYHNTAYNADAERHTGIIDSGGRLRYATVRNNIFAFPGRPVYDRRKDPQNTYDYDLFPPDDVPRTPDEQEQHAVRVGDPGFADAGAGDFSLTPQSPAIDRGIPIPGFNDGHRGEGPDMGAFEAGDEAPHYGRRGQGGDGTA